MVSELFLIGLVSLVWSLLHGVVGCGEKASRILLRCGIARLVLTGLFSFGAVTMWTFLVRYCVGYYSVGVVEGWCGYEPSGLVS